MMKNLQTKCEWIDRRTRMLHVGLSEHDDNLKSVSSQCARGKLSISHKPEFHPKKFNGNFLKKKVNI